MIEILKTESNNGIKNIYFEHTFKGIPYGNLKVEISNGIGHLHFDVTNWNHNILKENKNDLHRRVIPYIKGLGCKRIVSSFNKNTGDGNVEKWKKYVSAIGLPEPEATFISIMEV